MAQAETGWSSVPTDRGAALLLVAMALGAAACGGGQPSTNAPWLTMPDQAQHAPMFVLAGTPHAALDCNGCHTTATTFKTFDCAGCHTKAQCDTAHLNVVAGYAFAMPACVDCHKDGTTGTVDHTKFFAIGAGTSHALACTDCHTDAARRSDPATLACATCHATRAGFSTAHAAVKDFTASSPACLKCHAEPPVTTVAAHQAQFPIALGSATHDTACLSCHTTLRTDKPWAADFTAYACTACHAKAATDPLHAGVTGYAFASASCFGCHAGGTAALDHTRFFAIGAGTSHALACADCHTDPANRASTATLACASCHATRPGFGTAHAAVKDFASDSPACLKCHADPPVTTVAAHQAKFPIALGSTTHDTACLSCHTTLRTDKAWAADFAAFACTGCHAKAATDPLHTGTTGYVFASASCYGCHANGTGGAPANHPSLFPIAAGSAHATVGCAQCHGDPANRGNTATLLCASCHASRDTALATKHTGATIPVTDFSADSPSCLKCHADSQVDAGSSHPRGDSTPTGNSNHLTAGCTKCHSGLRTDKPFTAASWSTTPGCVTCHKNGIPN